MLVRLLPLCVALQSYLQTFVDLSVSLQAGLRASEIIHSLRCSQSFQPLLIQPVFQAVPQLLSLNQPELH